MFHITIKSRIVFIAIVLICPWIFYLIPAVSHYLDILIFAGIYCLITIGLSLLMGYAGQISLGHAAFFGIGAYISGILTTKYGLNPWVCILIALFVSGFIAYCIGVPTLKLHGHYLAMGTLAFGIITFIIFNEEITYTGGPDGMGNIKELQLLGFPIDTNMKYYYLVWLTVVLALLFSVNLIQSRVGRALRAIHTSEVAASSMGVNVAGYKIQIFVFSAILASISGSFYAHYIKFLNPTSFDLFFSIKLLIMIVMGGMRSIWGAIIGAVIIAFLSFEWLGAFHEFETLAYGAILLLVTIFLPDGLVSLPGKFSEQINKYLSKIKA
ncbi:MAG: branched-chain amino acid ABC transporter permease [Deltaproteobacteria bacterium]|nr:branched-chain amino acid ABC transporter permease [Deltaproteobacteria bacterium]